MPEPVPVTLLTGFLGAGKTTLLNRLLDAPGAGRFAVIVNETGDIALDGRLVVGSTEEIVELRDGCVCCTVRGDLSVAVARLLRRRSAWLRRLAFDRLIVECSGLASPGPVVQTFLLDAHLAAHTHVDGVIAVASAADVARQLREHPETAEQLGYADRIVLNHADRVDAAGLASAEAAIRAVNPSVPLDRAVRVDVDPAPLLAMGGLDAARWRLDGGRHAHGDHGPAPAAHGSAITHVSLRSTNELDVARLKLFLQFVAARRTWSVLRLKGIFRCADQPRAVVAHGVYQWLELGAGALDAPAVSQLLLIGRGLDAGEIERAWVAAGG